MIRARLLERQVGAEAGFGWRGDDVSRIEGFSDAVFAFALTLLVVSLAVPATFSELLAAMNGFVAFAVTFTALLVVWFWHYRYFRRYGLEDAATLWLNGVLLFVVLFYVYPLKFLTTFLIDAWLGLGDSAGIRGPVTPADVASLMLIYGLGYLAVQTVFALLYAHAYRLRGALALSAVETFDTLTSVYNALVGAGVALVSLALVVIGGPAQAGWAGVIYPVLLMPGLTLLGFARGRGRRALEEGASG